MVESLSYVSYVNNLFKQIQYYSVCEALAAVAATQQQIGREIYNEKVLTLVHFLVLQNKY